MQVFPLVATIAIVRILFRWALFLYPLVPFFYGGAGGIFLRAPKFNLHFKLRDQWIGENRGNPEFGRQNA